MYKRTSPSPVSPSPAKIRMAAFVFAPLMLALGIFSVYWLWSDVLPLFGRLYRNAPVVETPYLGFFLISVVLITPLALLICVMAGWHGRKFDPDASSWLTRFSHLSMWMTWKSMLYVSPALIVLITATLLLRDYWPCPKLLISGSAWQLFWVNDERVCFKPDFYINDNWPCTRTADKNICIQVDGR